MLLLHTQLPLFDKLFGTLSSLCKATLSTTLIGLIPLCLLLLLLFLSSLFLFLLLLVQGQLDDRCIDLLRLLRPPQLSTQFSRNFDI